MQRPLAQNSRSSAKMRHVGGSRGLVSFVPSMTTEDMVFLVFIINIQMKTELALTVPLKENAPLRGKIICQFGTDSLGQSMIQKGRKGCHEQGKIANAPGSA